MRHRRTLVPGVRLLRMAAEGRQRPQAYWVRPRNGDVVAFAGLWETFSAATARKSTPARHDDSRQQGDRSPSITVCRWLFGPENFERWLDCCTLEPRDVLDLLEPVDDDFFEAIPVSDRVNKGRQYGP